MKKRILINVTRTDLPKIDLYIRYLKRLWQTHWITNNGEFVQLLERKLKKYLKVKHLILVNNGTLAIQLIIKALQLKGEVITTPFTFAATSTALIWEGQTPVFADINPNTYNISPSDVEKKITKKTSAIFAVHVYGNPCDVEKLDVIAKKYRLKLIYDAAHAFGVEYNKKSVLRYGDASILSFHATKIFHTIEGGAIIVNNKKLYQKLKLLQNFGIQSEEKVLLPGINAKMNEFQAAMGLANLPYLESNRQKRKKIYLAYLDGFANNKSIGLQKLICSKYNYSYLPILLKDEKTRNILFDKLIENGIKPRKYFYPLITDFEFYKNDKLNEKYQINEAKIVAQRILCLPLYSSLSMQSAKKIIKIIVQSLS